MQDQVDYYKEQGFREVETDSGTGSTILVSNEKQRAVKFNFDPPYDRFVLIAQSQSLGAFPKIYEHASRNIESGPLTQRRYTITEMELLDPLSVEEKAKVVSWIQSIYIDRRSGVPLNAIKADPFGLLEAITILLKFAADNNLHLDLAKGTNYMVRLGSESREFVITDPFN